MCGKFGSGPPDGTVIHRLVCRGYSRSYSGQVAEYEPFTGVHRMAQAGAGGENRTRVASLEGWSFTTKLHPLTPACAGLRRGVPALNLRSWRHMPARSRPHRKIGAAETFGNQDTTRPGIGGQGDRLACGFPGIRKGPGGQGMDRASRLKPILHAPSTVLDGGWRRGRPTVQDLANADEEGLALVGLVNNIAGTGREQTVGDFLLGVAAGQ